MPSCCCSAQPFPRSSNGYSHLNPFLRIAIAGGRKSPLGDVKPVSGSWVCAEPVQLGTTYLSLLAKRAVDTRSFPKQRRDIPPYTCYAQETCWLYYFIVLCRKRQVQVGRRWRADCIAYGRRRNKVSLAFFSGSHHHSVCPGQARDMRNACVRAYMTPCRGSYPHFVDKVFRTHMLHTVFPNPLHLHYPFARASCGPLARICLVLLLYLALI